MVPLRPTCAALAAALLAACADACTIIAVGKDASASGHPMVTHSDDSGPMTTDIRLVRVPRKKHEKGSMRPVYLWSIPYPRIVSAEKAPDYAPVDGQEEFKPMLEIPEVEETWAYWDTDYGVQNEWGLSIGESTCTAMTVGWPATPGKPYGYNTMGIDEMTKIAMERCKTARCAIETMGPLAVKYGFYSADGGTPEEPAYSGSAEGIIIADADPGDVWIFNVLTGKNNASAIWAAQRIPSDHVAAVGNSFTIRKLNLNDPENNLYSPGVTELAQEMGWWSPEEEETPGLFNFFSAYGYQPPPAGHLPWEQGNMINILKFYSGRRMWRIFSLLSPAEGAKLDPNLGNVPKTKNPYPPSVSAPKGSVTLTMVMDTHRDHYEGTPYDLTKGMAAGPFGNPNREKALPTVYGQWERAISMYRTSFSFVLVPRPKRRSMVWFGYDAAHGTAYLPFYGAASGLAPKGWRTGKQSKYSSDCAWWAFNLVNAWSEMNFQLINPDVLAKAKATEVEAQKLVEEWEAAADKLEGEEAAMDYLTQNTNEYAEKKVAEWWDLLHSLYGRYARYAVTWGEGEDAEDVFGQHYPMWWLSSPDIGYLAWEPTNPHGFRDTMMGPPPNSAPWDPPSAKAEVPTAGQSPAVVLSVTVAMAASLAIVASLAFRAGVREGQKQALGADIYIRAV